MAIILDGSTGLTIPSVTTTDLAYTNTLTGGTGIIAIGTNQIYKDASGNVGIGTSSPETKLQIVGNATFGTTGISGTVLRISTDGANGILLRADRSEASAARYLAFGTDYNERMRIDSSGNVGIGSSSDNPTPAAPLHITAGTAQTAVVTAVTTQLRLARSGTGGVKYSTQADFKLGTYATGINSQTQLDIALGNGATNTPDVTVMTLLGSGNVGIGTSNPVCKLHVYSSTAQNATYGFVHIESPIAASDATSNASYTAKNYSGTSQFMQWENYGLRIGSRIITNTGAGHVIFTTGNDVERMRIDSSGRITTPSQPAFHATSANAPTTGVEWVFNAVTFNRGNYYNATTGRFTAPVTGVYYFYAFGLAGNADTSDIRFSLRVNSVIFAGARFIITKSAASWQTIRGQAVMNLNAGDYVSPWNDQSAIAFHTDSNYTGFGGYLIG